MSTARWITMTIAVVVGLSVRSFAEPRIDSVSLRGLQLGRKTTIVVTGAELLPEPGVSLSGVPVDAAVKEGGTAERVELDIALPSGTEAAARGACPGIWLLRIANEHGISNPAAVVVDDLPQVAWASELPSGPVAASGVCDGATKLITSLAGKQDQLLAVEVEAHRLGSTLNPTIRVLDEQGVQIAWAQADSLLDGDARLVTTLPRDGKYQIELHDALFQGQPPAFFRLKIASEAAPTTPFRRAMSGAEVESRGLIALLCDGSIANGWHAVRQTRPSAAPTGLLRLFLSNHREAVEDEDALLLGPLPAPVGINGRIGSPGETDKFIITAKPGATVRVQCIAERANSPLDGVLTVLDAGGNQLATADDQPGTVDPGLEFAMPEAPVTLSLRDLRHRGGDEFRYRLSVLPADQPQFKLTLDADRYQIPRGGVALVRAHVDRQAIDAPVEVLLDGLPEGIVAENAEIPAGATDALVTLRATQDKAAAVLHVHGQATNDSLSIIETATTPATAVSRFSPWLAGEVAVATTAAAPMSLVWNSASAGDVLTLGSTTTLGVELQRASGVAGPVRLTLLTTQLPPMKQENNQNVPDVPRTLRLAQEVTIAADQSAAQVPVTVPADLAQVPHDLAIKAELLSMDGSQVLATAFSPAQRLPVARPSYTIELAEAAAIAPAAENQLNVQLHGKLIRPEGFTSAVAVRIDGLPAAIPAPMGIVPEGQSEFTLTATLPPTLSLGELRQAKIVAVSELAPGIVIPAANEIPLTLQLGAED